MKKQLILITTCLALSSVTSQTFAEETAPVSGFARSFLMDSVISNATIKVLETGQVFKTDEKGNFGPIAFPLGKAITLEFSKFGYKTTLSETIIVPKEGLTGPYRNITFQVPSIFTYYILAAIIGAKIDPDSCHVTTTIISHNKTLNDLPQGEVNAKVTLAPKINVTPFYFDIFRNKFLKDKTNPFTRNLTQTSADGGVAFFNLPASDKPYTISAIKQGIIFSQTQFLCRKGVFINISPPRGPMAKS